MGYSEEYKRGVKEFYEYISKVEIENLDAPAEPFAATLWEDFWKKASSKRDEIIGD